LHKAGTLGNFARIDKRCILSGLGGGSRDRPAGHAGFAQATALIGEISGGETSCSVPHNR
jgi:hypothetical protein